MYNKRQPESNQTLTARFKRLKKAEHGGRGGVSTRFLDFSASLNPCAPVLDRSIPDESIRKYPDDNYTRLKEIIARHHHREPDEICVGNGSAEVMRTLCHTVLSPGKTAYIPLHTFSEYALSARLAGAEITHLSGAQTDISFLCNPDNPSGILTRRSDVIDLAHRISGSGGLLCVDEAFIDLADPAESISDVRDSHIFVIRSLTKSFSMAGVRFGYGIGDAELIEAMEVMRPPWSVNAFAESMAIQAFEHHPALEESRQYIRKERDRISRKCRELNLIPSHASANYILLDTGKSGTDLSVMMQEQGIMVRDCSSFGLPSCIRVAVNKSEENDLLLEALERCLH